MKKLVLISTLAATMLLASCGGHPMPEDYLGPLSARYTALVSETYFVRRLSCAYIDVDADRRFDFFVNFDDSGRSIDSISDADILIDQYVKDTSGLSHSTTRPQGVEASALLERVVEAYRRPPDAGLLSQLYSGEKDVTERWLLAATLRRGGSIPEVVASKAFEHLVAGEFTMESAFLLAGLGEKGISMLGQAMLETRDKRAARDAAIYLSWAEQDALAALDKLVASLDKDWRNTQHCVLAAILNVAEAYPDSVRIHLSHIRKHADHSDADIRRYVHRIEKATLTNLAEQSPAGDVLKAAPEE